MKGMKKMAKIIKTVTLAVSICLMSIMGLVWFYSATLPDTYYVGENPLSISALFSISSKPCKSKTSYAATYDTEDLNLVTKITDSTLLLFDSIPIKQVQEKTVTRPLLVPSGQPFGIKLLTEGVVVVRLEQMNGVCPATDCGIQVGDVIISVNGEKVDSNTKISEIVSASRGEPCDVIYIRNSEQKVATLTPVLYDGGYKCGVWVRDSSAGIGTLTFYDPETDAFGGLGHAICDCDTNLPLPLSTGTVGDVEITGYDKSKKGEPGQLTGEFMGYSTSGEITANADCGIFGILEEYSGENRAMPMGFRQEIHTGEATIYTTIDGDTPEEYTIEIERVNLQESSEHDMIIRITDRELLEKTGGIVQGMSGSPIIQDGRLVGAVTHVFVEDPDKGYGIFAETMYEQACSCTEDEPDLAS